MVRRENRLSEDCKLLEKTGKKVREVAGAGTKGRYDPRLPSVSFALGLNVCLIDNELRGYQVDTVFQFSRSRFGQAKVPLLFASIYSRIFI